MQVFIQNSFGTLKNCRIFFSICNSMKVIFNFFFNPKFDSVFSPHVMSIVSTNIPSIFSFYSSHWSCCCAIQILACVIRLIEQIMLNKHLACYFWPMFCQICLNITVFVAIAKMIHFFFGEKPYVLVLKLCRYFPNIPKSFKQPITFLIN